jgi:hypothetical protein
LDIIDQEFIDEHRALIAAAEACWRKENPSHSWHVFEWMAFKLRCKYPIIRKKDQIIRLDAAS